jgi:hypothetical protein
MKPSLTCEFAAIYQSRSDGQKGIYLSVICGAMRA